MKRFLSIALLVLALAAGAAAGTIYGMSEWRLRRAYDAPLLPLVPVAAPNLVEGDRMARIVGCLNGCHGAEGQGGFEEVPGVVRHSAPTLSAVLPQYTDDELVRLIRYGLKRDSTSALGMISYTFWAIGDQDLANIIARLRQLPTVEAVPRTLELTWLGRLALAIGRWQVSVDQVDRSRPRWGNLPMETPHDRGRYLASVTCTECHGLDFRGDALQGAPSLAVLGGYTPAQFRHLMRTAEPASGRTLNPMMSWVKNAPFTDGEVDALYTFLRAKHGFTP